MPETNGKTNARTNVDEALRCGKAVVALLAHTKARDGVLRHDAALDLRRVLQIGAELLAATTRALDDLEAEGVRLCESCGKPEKPHQFRHPFRAKGAWTKGAPS